MTELEVDLGALVANWERLVGLHAGGAVAGVVKADAYGLGAAAVVPALYAAGCRHFFTAHLAEAEAAKRLAPEAMVAALNGLWPGTAERFRESGVLPVLGSLADIDAWSGPALLHVDTGMNRLGLPEAEVAALAEDGARRRRIEPVYVMTHLVSAELPEAAINGAQRARFAAACAALAPGAPRSLANSSGIFLGPDFGSDLARPGAALYGINPTPGRDNPMQGVVTLRARILQTRRVRAGDAVGYNATWTAARDSVIGTVSVGYADGYLRSLSSRAEAVFDGVRVPLVGRVSMDLSTFDLTGTAAEAGDWLELIGPALPVDAVAERAGTNGYEILTSLGPRYARAYRGG